MSALAEQLVEYATPGLTAAGDLAAVRSGLARLHRLGTGAARRRLTLRRCGRLTAVVGELAALTTSAA
ncbi:hypothetical protein C2142_01125 [Streptomyces sp. CB01881]|nr:hypothetical protein C2142_01125 [Streptomyces sp. CB01881]